MKKVLFVCTGNTCRSIMTQKMFEKMVEQENLESKIEVYSAGIYADQRDGASPQAIEALKENDIILKDYRAVNINSIKVEEMDLILCMTLSQKYMVQQMYANKKEGIFTLREYVEKENTTTDIKDPYGTDVQTYLRCLEEIKELLEIVLLKFKKEIKDE